VKALSTVRALSGVRRAWPGRDCSITFELAAPAGKLRAGRVNREGEVWITGYASDGRVVEFGQHVYRPSLYSFHFSLFTS